jgi:hypothetical protein
MPRAVVTGDWRKLSKAARKERDPDKFVYLLKQLYDLVNEDEGKRGVSREAKLHRQKGTRLKRGLRAA